MNTPGTIQKYMADLDWTVIDLARKTLIHHVLLEQYFAGKEPLTQHQVMNIINKITLQYPQEQHWNIYHEIIVQPEMKGENK